MSQDETFVEDVCPQSGLAEWKHAPAPVFYWRYVLFWDPYEYFKLHVTDSYIDFPIHIYLSKDFKK